jgi:hypothetical protein
LSNLFSYALVFVSANSKLSPLFIDFLYLPENSTYKMYKSLLTSSTIKKERSTQGTADGLVLIIPSQRNKTTEYVLTIS